MKRIGFFILLLAFGVYLAGCGKKQAAEESAQESMSMENLSEVKATPEVKTQEAKSAAGQVTSAPEPKLAPLPPSGPYKPTISEIQTALKNAGFYEGSVDGKTGPKTKKAIEAFQKSKGLKADGKVGAKTWNALSAYLNGVPQETASPAEKKR